MTKDSHHLPLVSVPDNFQIGYRPGRFSGSRTNLLLAETSSAIELCNGRHLLLARNGRGKTTLLKTIAGIIPSLKGEIALNGTVQFVDEDLRFDDELKTRNLLKALFKGDQLSFAHSMADTIELDLEKPYGKLSKGNRQKVALVVAEARAHGKDSQVLLLDEPFSGLDFAAREKVDAIWSESENSIVRLVCVHPDEPTLKADSAIMISEGRLEQIQVKGSLDWLEARKTLI